MVKNKEAHLLVIRLSSLGDVAMTVPVLLALTQQYPAVRITILTRPGFKPLFSQLERVRVFGADLKGKHKGIGGLWTLYRELRVLDIHAIADLHHVLRTAILKRYFSLEKIPFIQIDKGRKEKKALTAANNKRFTPLKTTHQRYADVFEALGYTTDLSKVSLLKKAPLSGKMLDLVGRDRKIHIGIAPFAAYAGKCYPRDKMLEVIKMLGEDPALKILLFGGGNKEQLELDQWVRSYPHCLNIAGKLSLEEELAIISNLDLMVSMDSANGHLAAMYGIPVLTLWGVTHPYSGFSPFGQQKDNALLSDRDKFPLIPTSVYGNKIPKGYEKAMHSISPNEVIKKIRKLLNKK